MSAAVVSASSRITEQSTLMLAALERRCSSECSSGNSCEEGAKLFYQYYLANIRAHIATPDAWLGVLEAITTSHVNVEGTQERYSIDAFIPLAMQASATRAAESRAKFASTGTFDRHTDGNECVFSEQPFSSSENPNQTLAYAFRGVGKQIHIRCYSDIALGALPERPDQNLGLVVTAEGIYESSSQANLRLPVKTISLGRPKTHGNKKFADGVITVPEGLQADAKAVVYSVIFKVEFIGRHVERWEGGVLQRIPDYEGKVIGRSRFAWIR